MILVLIGFVGVVLFAVGIFFSSNSVGPIIGITGAFSLSYSAYKLECQHKTGQIFKGVRLCNRRVIDSRVNHGGVYG
jgi:hypothetical protein